MARGRGSRMQKQWIVIPGGPLILSAAGTNLGGSVVSVAFPATIIRMLGEYSIGIGAAAPTALDEAQIGVGIGVFSTDAVAVGGASLSDPTGDPGYPWLYWADHLVFFPTNSQTNASAQASVRRTFDVRSMRRIKADQSLALVVGYVDVVGAPPIHVSVGTTRVLIAT